ncbi:MAG: carboxylating nicotinate-nucleotide diphosphorylase [Vampirovibrionales bacterium]|nr:carboxylating nicotinate-nucleotide diphosphorylase [Vampirovibrionales bacterium]
MMDSIEDWIEEDGVLLDITTRGLLHACSAIDTGSNKPVKAIVEAVIVARVDCVASGHAVVEALLKSFTQKTQEGVSICWHAQPADKVRANEKMASLTGSFQSVLAIERLILNTLQIASATATHTRRFAEALATTQTVIAHTRKTIPGLRKLQRQAVLDGGGCLHRGSLSEAALVKDNHWALLKSQHISAHDGLLALRRFLPHTARLCVEVDNLSQLSDLMGSPSTASLIDVILLDNFTPVHIQQAVEVIDHRAVVEVSGGITLDTIRDYALPGVDVISTSQLTFGCPNIDIGLDFL